MMAIWLLLLPGGLWAPFESGMPGVLSAPCAEDPAVAAAIARELPRTVAIRRQIHEHPELGEREVETAKLVAARLKELGLTLREGVAKTGVVGVLRGGQPGGCVAWRADMDALPVTEQTAVAFKSTRTDTWDGKDVGVMHACGHDVHTSVALGVAAVLADPAVRKDLHGSVLFLFQLAEESLPDPGIHGAARMIAEGALDDPRPGAVFGLHCGPHLEVGTIGVRAGGALAAADQVRITIVGKQTHGAQPELGIDPIVVASHIVLALENIPAREIDARETLVLTIGKIEAGNRFNIIPERAELLGTLRTHDAKVQERAHVRIREIAEGTAKTFGATAEVEIREFTPVTWNDPDLVARMRAAFEAAVGKANVIDDKPVMGAEDFAFYGKRAPGLFFFLGVAPKGKPAPGQLHTPTFDPDEGCIEVGIRAASGLITSYLAAQSR
jgi:amidohydrolase